MKLRTKKGFTLVELLAVMAIFVTITTIVMFGNGNFNNTIVLTNLAYDVALTVARAQTYGTNVKQLGTGSDVFNTGYGVHFRLCGTTADTQESDQASFVLFADADRNHYYEKSATPTEFLERYLIKRGNQINKLYWLDSAGVVTEISGGVDVAFLRPDPDANFAFFDCAGNSVSHNARAVRVQVISPANLTKNIDIEATGQISVQ